MTAEQAMPLARKLVEISRRVGQMEKTGKRNDAGGRFEFYGHEQIEAALNRELAEAGILTLWSTAESRQLDARGWWVREEVTYIDAATGEALSAHTDDTGNSLAGAKSFARKSHYRGWLHLAEPEEEDGGKSAHKPNDTKPVAGSPQEPSQRSTEASMVDAVVAAVDGVVLPSCPQCGKPLKERQRRDGKGSFVGCSGFPGCDYIERKAKPVTIASRRRAWRMVT